VYGNDIYFDGTKVAWPGWPGPVTTSFIYTGVAPGVHTFAVSSYNSTGEGAPSAPVVVNVTEPALPTQSPSALVDLWQVTVKG
jgi:hypothetical protein